MANNSLTLAFADGEYVFRLTLAGINEIQTKCEAGIGAVWARLASARLNIVTGDDVGVPNNAYSGETARWRIEDIVETIRQGLLGGGEGMADGKEVKVTPIVANRLIDAYVLGRPLQDSWSIAYAIVGGLIEGYDPPKKKEPMTDPADGSITDKP